LGWKFIFYQKFHWLKVVPFNHWPLIKKRIHIWTRGILNLPGIVTKVSHRENFLGNNSLGIGLVLVSGLPIQLAVNFLLTIHKLTHSGEKGALGF